MGGMGCRGTFLLLRGHLGQLFILFVKRLALKFDCGGASDHLAFFR